MKRFLSLTLVVLMLLAIVPFAAFSANGATVISTNVALGKTVTTSRTNTGVTSAYHPIKCNAGLTDGVASNSVSASSIGNNTWFAFQTYSNTETTGSFGTVGTAIVDLEAVTNLSSVRVHLANLSLTLSNGCAFAPKANKVEVLVSNSKNGTYTSVGSVNTSAKSGAFWAEVSLDNVSARYVKVAVTVNAPDASAYYAILNEIEIYNAVDNSSDDTTASPVKDTLRIGSFNIAHVGQFTFTKANLDSLANDILSQDLDIIGFQEAVCGIFGKGTADERYIDSLAELKARTGYEHVYYFNWDDTSNTAWGIMSKYPIVNLGKGTVVKTPIWSISKDGDGAYNSKQYNTVPNYAISETAGSDFIQIDVNGTIINFWNTHGRPNNYAERFALIDGSEENFIMVGDYNNPTYEALTDFELSNGTLLGSFTSLVNYYGNKIITYPRDQKFMDNIIYTDDFKLLSSGAVANDSGASDHYLLWAEFEVAPKTNIAVNKKVTTSRTNTGVTSAYHPIKCNASLTDGIASDRTNASSIGNNTWFAFQTYANTETTGSYGTVGSAIVDLEAVTDISSVRVHLANLNLTLSNGCAFAPKANKVEILVSNTKNGTYTSVGSVNASAENGAYWAEIDLANVSARYVKVAVTVDAPNVAAYYAILNEIQIFA